MYTHTGCDGFTAPYLFVKVPLHQYSSLMEEEESGVQGVGQHLWGMGEEVCVCVCVCVHVCMCACALPTFLMMASTASRRPADLLLSSAKRTRTSTTSPRDTCLCDM